MTLDRCAWRRALARLPNNRSTCPIQNSCGFGCGHQLVQELAGFRRDVQHLVGTIIGGRIVTGARRRLAAELGQSFRSWMVDRSLDGVISGLL